MSSELITLLEQEAAAERDRVLAEARIQAEEIRATAQAEARRVVETQREQQEMALRAARVRAQSTAQLQAQALVLEQKDQAISEVFRRAEGELEAVMQDRPRYELVIQRLIGESVREFRGPFVIEVHSDDEDLAREQVDALKAIETLAGRNPEWKPVVRPAEGIRGGVRLISADGRYVVLNTLTSRLARARPTLVSEVAKVLWG